MPTKTRKFSLLIRVIKLHVLRTRLRRKEISVFYFSFSELAVDNQLKVGYLRVNV